MFSLLFRVDGELERSQPDVVDFDTVHGKLFAKQMDAATTGHVLHMEGTGRMCCFFLHKDGSHKFIVVRVLADKDKQ